jgi:hypothetical protein
MPDEPRGVERASTEDYEPPAVVELGSTAKMTAIAQDASSLDDSSGPSDAHLKVDVRAVERPFELLRAIRTL